MKLCSYQVQGQASFGLVQGTGIFDLKNGLNGKFKDLKALIEANGFAQAAAFPTDRSPDIDLAHVRLLPVIPEPNKIICVGLNYHAHVQETGRALTEKPAIFLRVSGSQVGAEQNILRPAESERLDYEGEIAVIIGKQGRRIDPEDAWTHIAGYSCYNDGSVRDWQAATTQWTAGKNFCQTGAFGPWMVTADEIVPNQTLTLVTRLNGAEMQRASTDMMIHSIPELIAHVSTFTALLPGDVLVTGTPGGVGNKRNPQVFMKPGDVVEVEVDAIGVLRNTIADEL